MAKEIPLCISTLQSRGGRYGKNIISRFILEISRFTILSRFFVMLVLLFCKLSEEYSQTNFPIIKPFKVTKKKKERQIFIIIIICYMYSGYGKYSDPLTCFTLLYCSHLLKSFKFIFFLSVHTAPHIDRKTQNCWHFCKFIKKEKLKYHMVLSIQTLCCDTHSINIFSSGVVHFFWSSLRWFYTFIWVQLCLIILIGLD